MTHSGVDITNVITGDVGHLAGCSWRERSCRSYGGGLGAFFKKKLAEAAASMQFTALAIIIGLHLAAMVNNVGLNSSPLPFPAQSWCIQARIQDFLKGVG